MESYRFDGCYMTQNQKIYLNAFFLNFFNNCKPGNIWYKYHNIAGHIMKLSFTNQIIKYQKFIFDPNST